MPWSYPLGRTIPPRGSNLDAMAPRRTQVTPYLLYEDVAAALSWLAEAFGLEERLRFTDANGNVTHAEMEIGEGLVMMGDPGPDYRSPKRLGARTAQVHVYVDDVDAHFERAKAA